MHINFILNDVWQVAQLPADVQMLIYSYCCERLIKAFSQPHKSEKARDSGISDQSQT